MTPTEFFDKENGTRHALAPRGMSDSDRNIMADLAHEACEFHCEDCNACLTEDELDPDHGTCEDCTPAKVYECREEDPDDDEGSWKNCPCNDCADERSLERGKMSDPERYETL